MKTIRHLASWMRALPRRVVRIRLIGCFFFSFEWFRRLHGGKWVHVWVEPVFSFLWLPVPDEVTPDYREGGWRGTPTLVSYP